VTILYRASICGRVSFWLGLYPFPFIYPDWLGDVSLGLALLNRKSPPSRWQWVGEAPVTPVSILDSSFLTFPTNHAITSLIAAMWRKYQVVIIWQTIPNVATWNSWSLMENNCETWLSIVNHGKPQSIMVMVNQVQPCSEYHPQWRSTIVKVYIS